MINNIHTYCLFLIRLFSFSPPFFSFFPHLFGTIFAKKACCGSFWYLIREVVRQETDNSYRPTDFPGPYSVRGDLHENGPTTGIGQLKDRCSPFDSVLGLLKFSGE
jgi:hypothetical protein